MARNLIPQYSAPTANLRPLDFSGINRAVDSYQRNKMFMADQQRKKIHDIYKVMEDYDPGSMHKEKHTEEFAKKIEEFEDELANAMTYEKDKDGNFTQKLRRFFGTEPKFTDTEYAEYMQKALALGKEMKKKNEDSKAMSAWAEEFKSKPKGTYDPSTFKIVADHYEKYDEILKPALAPASVNPYSYVKNHDPRTTQEIADNTTEELIGNKLVKTTKPLETEVQDNIYYGLADNDYTFQRTLVDAMMKDQSMPTEDKIDLMKGYLGGDQLADYDVRAIRIKASLGVPLSTEEKIALSADKKIRESILNYESMREFPPELIESAKYYGAQVLGLNREIGKGSRSEKLAPKWMVEGNSEDKDESIKPQEREINVPGTNISFKNAVDLSTISETESQKRSLTGFVMPKGAIKVTADEGKTTTNKTFDELKQQGDYIIDWYDKKAGVIQVRSRSEKDMYGRDGKPNYFIVPIRGNEYILSKIKSFENKKVEPKKGFLD